MERTRKLGREDKVRTGDVQWLGDLGFKGPFPIRMVDNQEEILFPAPLHILGQPTKEEGEQWSQITKLRLEKVLIVT